MYTIYAFENRLDKRVYIGQSVQPAKRLYQHRVALKAGKHQNKFFQRAWDKDGENAFDHFTLCECVTKEEADATEIDLIAWYKELGLCYNHTKGGDGGNTVTDDNRLSVSEKTKARIAAQGHPMQGKHHTEEAKQKMRDARVGWKPSPEHMAKVQEGLKAVGRTEEHRRKGGESKKGNTYWKGRSHSAETIQAMSEARMGEANPHYGKPTSEKQKAAASVTWKGVKRGPMSEETKQKLREARAKQVMAPMSDETREKIRAKKVERDLAARGSKTINV